MFTFATSANVTGTVTVSPALPSAVPTVTLRPFVGPPITTLPGVLVTAVIFAIVPSPKAPPSLKVIGVVVLVAVLLILNVIFANTPSESINSSVIVLSKNRKLIVPLLALLEKLTAEFLTIGPAAIDTTSNRLASYPR